jgi:hypothetical protein
MAPSASTTELKAVNTMLTAIGETPVNSLSNTPSPDIAIAQSILEETSREMQLEGWWFNTEHDWTLTPDANNELVVPANTFSVDLNYPEQWDQDIVLRGNRVYDRENQTYKFDETMDVFLVRMLPFDELPEAARNYVIKRSTRIFQDRVVSSDKLHKYHERDEQIARARLEQHEADQSDVSPFLTERMQEATRRF